MKPKSEYTRDEYTREVIALWEDAVRVVYLKEPGEGNGQDMAKRAWEGTRMTPLDYVKFVADPRWITNMIGRGQKAREKRWDAWVARQGEGQP